MNKNQNPQKLIQETLHATKKFLQRTAKNIKSLYKNLSKTSRSDPVIFPDNIKNLHNHNICMKNEVIDQEKYSKISLTNTVPNHSSKSKDDSENAVKRRDGGKPSFRAAEALAKKMKELEMMDIKDKDHVSDIEEILHDYSQLSHPAYVEIVDNFFMDMYTELFVPLPLMGRCSVHGSMRKMVVGSDYSLHGSMRSLGPIKL